MSLLSLLNIIQHQAEQNTNFGSEQIFGLLELPFLIIAVVFSFMTARKLKGGIFGKGMLLLAWGFLVMALGHISMQVNHIYGFDIFNELFGNVGGRYAWFIALITTWGLSILGFYQIYKASKL